MAEPLAFRNLEPTEGPSEDSTHGRNAVDRYFSHSLNDHSSNNSSDDEDDRDDNRDERLLVRSTISRDTTQSTPAVDLVDLSKLAAHRDDLPLNTDGGVSQGFGPPPPPPPPGTKSGPVPPPDLASSAQVSYDLVGPPPPPPNARGPPGAPPPAPLKLPAPYTVFGGINTTRAPTSIAAARLGGSSLVNAYTETWRDKQRFTSYNWRDKLRITGRRKSESDLGFRYAVDDRSSLSEHLHPNASMRRLVNAWKENGLATPGKVSEKASRKGDNAEPRRELETSLARTAETFLGLDLHDDTPQSMFFSNMLDTIAATRAERDFLAGVLTRPQPLRVPPPPKASDIPSVIVPKLKILHRIFCKSPFHGHDQSLFEDVPVRRFSERSQDLALSGSIGVRNLEYYCSQNPDISLIVFKEYLCVEDPNPRIPWRTHQRKGQRGSEVSPRSERLFVVSDLLQKLLDQIAICPEPESRINSRGSKEMAAPYPFLYHHRALLKEYEKKATGLMKQNLLVLLEFLQLNYGAEYLEADVEFSKGILTDKHIEKLFRPNEIVIEKSEGHEMAYVVREWPEILENELMISAWSWQYDGSYLQRTDTILKISLPLFEGFTIDKLSFCPLYMAKDTAIENLKKRGRKFWNMKEQYFCSFSGLDTSKTQTHHHTRVVIDMFTYSRMHPGKVKPASVLDIFRSDPWPQKIAREKTPDDNMIMLLPPTVYGFMLQEKKWLNLDVNGIHPIEWNKRAFDRLVLKPKTKELITALVEVRIAAGRAEDIIGGKGNGLMILLHGGPGTGKTLTAESVAEIAEKPLYRVTCGDIGTKADDVEKYLQTVLYLGKIWNCVLLLDEADIFLEERTIADLERNSLVSVFLRILEYYDGILIMTSNRVGTFDEAFKSRIQVSLHYEDLSKKSRRAIWSNFIAMLEDAEDDVNISDLESHLEEMASEEINGRQIRNSMTTARQLAVHRKERLQWEHLDQVLKTAREFNQYLKNVQGHTDKQWAREQRLR